MKIEGLETTYAKKLITQVLRALGREGCEIASLFLADNEASHKAIATRPMPCITDPAFPHSYAAWSLLRKSTMLKCGIDTEQAAYAAFAQTEYKCHLVNNHSGTSATDSISKSIGESILFYAQRKAADVLGEFCLDEFFDSCSHTGGASTQRKRTESSIKNKWSDVLDVTAEAAPVMGCFISSIVAGPKVMRLVEGSEAFTVPKDAKTDRLIFKEPQGNMFLQKGLGTMIRRRLLRSNINLNDQRINQRLASDNRYATIDLSNASNLISRSTVALLLQKCDPKWLYMLETTRSGVAVFDGKPHVLEMFSGMGNGFTFELESLLFFCLAYGASLCELYMNEYDGKGVISIYGDDIIVRTELYDTLTVGLQYCGFEVNVLKSYASGPFRESCGKHYYEGRDITPVYFKDRDFTKLQDWYYIINTLKDLNSRLCLPPIDEVINGIKKALRKRNLLNFVPCHFSKESGVHATFDEAVPKVMRKPRRRNTPHWNGFSVTVLVPSTTVYRTCDLGAYLCVLRRMSQDSRPQQPRLTGRTFALYVSKFETSAPPVYKVYRRGLPTEQIAQGELTNVGTYAFTKAQLPLGAWDSADNRE